MNILAVDDELIHRKMMLKYIADKIPDGEIAEFQDTVEALRWARNHKQKLVFTEIQMPVLTGIELAKELKKLNPKINIVFVTRCYEQYAAQAMDTYFSAYLRKPVTPKVIETALQNLRFPMPVNVGKRIRVQCFGDFEAYVDNHPIKFERTKTKELLAFLVDRHGALVTVNEICAALFENESNELNNKGYVRKCTNDLKNVLAKIGAKDLFIKGYNQYGIVTEQIECDYYDWEQRSPNEGGQTVELPVTRKDVPRFTRL